MLLTALIFLPLVFCLAIVLAPARATRGLALLGAAVVLVLATPPLINYGGAGAPPALSAILDQQVEAALKELGTTAAALGPAARREVGELRPALQKDPAQRTEAERRLLAKYPQVYELHDAARAAPSAHIRYVEHRPWIPSFRIHYFLGVDGLALPLIWLTALLTLICVIYSWNIEDTNERFRGTSKAYFSLFLFMETGLIGVFCALDFFLFYIFWEIVLLPMYFLIGYWGGDNRLYAAIKFFLYTLVGSVAMLIAMIALYLYQDPYSFNLMTLTRWAPGFSAAFQWWIFIALFVAFAVKVPVFPFHTWLPDAHVQAPTAASVMLAGMLLKMGTYGFFRFSYPLAPGAAGQSVFLGLLFGLGLVNLIYGAFCAMAQKDFKSLVAYSSISHMGYVLLGLAALTYAGVAGAAMQMVNHGITSAMLFIVVGVVYERAHHRRLDDFGGLAAVMPVYAGLAAVAFFASLGLPGLNSFISEAFVFLGLYHPDSTLRAHGWTWMVFAALPGIVLTAAYILWTVQRVFFGELPEKYQGFRDASAREILSLAPLAALCVILGVYPRVLLDIMDGSLSTLIGLVRAAS